MFAQESPYLRSNRGQVAEGFFRSFWRVKMDDVVIVAALRTAVGKFGGTLAKISAADLGSHLIKGLLAQTGIKPEMVNEVILGQVLTAGCGQNPARQAALRSGLSDMVPAFTVGKVCGSGLKATHLAAQGIRCGDAEIIIDRKSTRLNSSHSQ